jgi:ribosome biogenesis GTPase A
MDSLVPKFLAFGVVGKGKSTVLNHLTEGPNSDVERFKTSSGFDSCTMAVKSHKCKIHGTSKEVELFDIPGLLGADVNLELWKEIVDTGFSDKFNGILWVVSAKDRPSMNDVVLRQGLEFLLESFSENNVIMIITHCDLYKGSEPIESMKLAEQWVSAFNKNMKKPIRVTAAITFGMQKTATYTPNYHQEFAKLVDNYKAQTLGIQKKVNFQEYGESIMNAVHPSIVTGVENLLREQLSKMDKINEELQKQILKDNKAHMEALAAAGKPSKLEQMLSIVDSGLKIYDEWQSRRRPRINFY